MKQRAILFLRMALCLRKISLMTNVRASLDGDDVGARG